MSSWLSNNLTGGLSSISNFTGQISSFTREMLTEGTEEVSDPSAELQVAQARINDLEAHVLTQKSEYERLKQNNDELHVRLEASELQISNISKEYRAQLHNKEQELIKLRELSRFQEEHGHSFGRRERHDSTDSIEDSMEIKRLRSEISKLQTECQHWKSIANGVGNQDNLHKEIDQYQHELTALQSSYSQKISNLNKKHKQELQNLQDEKEEYLQRIEELEGRLLNPNDIEGDSPSDIQCDESAKIVSSLQKQLVFAEKSLVELKNQVKSHEQLMSALNAELQEKEHVIVTTRKNLDDMQTKFQNATELHDQAMSASESKLNKSFELVEKLQNQLQDQSKELSVSRSDSESLQKLQEDLNHVATENAELKEQLKGSQSEERRLHRCVEEVKSELEQLSSSTMELMEELHISQGLQQEQKIEMDNLKKVKYIKGDAKQEMAKLRSALAALWEHHLCLVQLYQQVRHELHNSNARLLAMFQAPHLSTNTVRDDLRELQHRLEDRGQAKLEHVVKEKEVMMGRSAELRVTVEELEGAVMDLQSDNEQVAQETKDCVTEMGRQIGIDEEEGSDVVTALHAEKAVLESTIVGLEHKVQDLQELVNSLQNQKTWNVNNECDERQASRSGSAESVASFTDSTQQEGELSMDMGDQLGGMTDPSLEPAVRQQIEVPLEGGDSTSEEFTLSELQQQLRDYQQQVEEFELAQRDWEGEKEALEGLVLSLRRQVKDLQALLADLGKENSSGEHEITRLRDENVRILSEKKHLLDTWKQIEEDFVSLNISSPNVANDSDEIDEERMQTLRKDLNRWSLNKSTTSFNDTEKSLSMSESSQTDERFELYLTKLEEFEKDNSLLRKETERLIQEIEEKTSEVTDLQSELEAKNGDVKSISDEKRDLVNMINERDERICELEESFNNHLLDLTSSKDNEISLLQTEQQDVVKLLEENRKECSLLKNKNNELLDLMGQHQLTHQELSEQTESLEALLAEKETDLKVLREEKDKLVTTVQHKEEVNDSLAAENNSMLMEKEVLQSLIEEYQDKLKSQKKQGEEKANLEKEIELLNQLIESSEERYQELNAKSTILSREKENLALEHQESTSKLHDVSSELKERFTEIEVLNEEKNKLVDALQSQALACKELEQKLSESIKEKDELNKQLGTKELQLTKLELDLREKGADIDLLKLDIAKLSKSLKEKEELIHTQVVNASSAGTQSSDDALYRQAQLLRLLEGKDQEIAALKQKDASLIELVSQTDQSTHRAQEQYEDKLKQLREERDGLLGDLSLRDEELLTMEDRLEAMREKMHGKDQASHLLHTEHARLLALNESQANEIGKLREKNSLLQKRVEEYSRSKSAELQRIQEDNNQLRRQVSALQVEHETLTTLIQEKDKQIATLALLGSDSSMPSSEGVEPQVKRLREERDVLLRERDSAFREKEIKEIEISQLQEEGYSLRQAIEEKSNLADGLLAENDELSKQFSKLQSELNSLSQDKSNLVRSDNRVKELEDQISSLRSVLESKNKELEQLLENSRNEKSSILVELESVKRERDDILEQKYIETGELKSKMFQLVHLLTDSDAKEQENVYDIDKNFQALLHTVRNQRNSALRERDNEIQSLREQLSNVTILNNATNTRGSELEEVLRDKEELHRMLRQARDEKEDVVREKESIVADLQDQIVSLSRTVSEKDRGSQLDLQRVIQEKERIISELDQAERDREQVKNANSQWQAETSRLQAELHELKGVLTQERGIISKLQREVDQYKIALQEKDRIVNDMVVEREQLQRTKENLHYRVQQLQEELSVASSGQKVAETKMAQELDRLRNHLVQVEESYTREALEAEEREKDLRVKLTRAEEQLLSSSHSMLDRDRQASVHIESLQEQLQAIAAQRDRAVMDLASIQEQAHQYQTSLSNLQLVLEQFQRERESQLRATQEQAQKEIDKAWAQVKELQTKENQLKSQLEMAARITQQVVDMQSQLKHKDEELLKHKEEVSRLEEELRVSQERIKNLNSLSDSKVEKSLVKNMLMGYFNTPENKRADVVHVIGGLLGFTHEELDKVGTGSSAPKGSWISSLIPFSHGAPKTPTRGTASQQKSFSELFVSFLESESEVPRSSMEASERVNNPLLSGMTPQQSTVSQTPGGLPIATSTPIGTPARNNLPTPLPSALSRPLATSVSGDVALGTRAYSSGTNGNPLFAGSLTPVQELPALSSSSSLRTLLEGRT